MMTIQARVVFVGSGVAEQDLGEKDDIVISKITELGRDAGLRATFQHDGKTVSRTVEGISPPDWETTTTPIVVRVYRSAGS